MDIYKNYLNIYLESINNQSNLKNNIVSEGVFDTLSKKVNEYFECFNNLTEQSKKLSSGQFDGDCDKLANDGKGALGNVTSKISFLQKPTDALVNVGQNSVGPLFQGPLDTAKEGGNMNKAVGDMLNKTKTAFGNGAQDAIKGSSGQTVSEETQRKVNKKLKIFFESRQFYRKQSHTRMALEKAFKYLIQENVKHAADPRSFYHNLDHDIFIATSTSNINILHDNQNKLIYEEKMLSGKHYKPIIIYEGVTDSNNWLCEKLGISADSSAQTIQASLTEKFNLTPAQANQLDQWGRVGGGDPNTPWSLSDGCVKKLFKLNPATSKEIFGDTQTNTIDKLKSLKRISSDSSANGQEGSLVRQIHDGKEKIKNGFKNFGTKIKTFIKKVYRPLYNLLIYIATIILRLLFALLRIIVKLIVKPLRKFIFPTLNWEHAGEKIDSWISNFADKNTKVKFTLTGDMQTEFQAIQMNQIVRKILRWTAFAGCVGITIWVASALIKFISGNPTHEKTATADNSSGNTTSSKPVKGFKKSKYC